MSHEQVYILTHDHARGNPKVYGLPLTERLYRQFSEYGFQNIFLVNTHNQPDVDSGNIITIPAQEIKNSIFKSSETDGEIYFIDASAVVDDRLIRFALKEPVNTRIASKNDPDLILIKTNYNTIKNIFDNLSEGNDVLSFRDQIVNFFKQNPPTVKYADEFDSYIDDLRLDYTPYFFPVDEKTDIRKSENIMYEANFKGTLDFIAIFIYKYPVREITRYISRFHWITPNQITFLSIVSSFAVPLLLALGYWGWAMLIGWAMFIFDSVDGKLARLTIRLSRTAGIIEHATSSPALFLWFASLGWYFSNGDILNPDLLSNIACWTLLVLYWVDKSVNGFFRAKFKYDLYNHSVFDKKFHLIACRRAIIHLIITAGYVTGKLLDGFYFLAGWMAFSFIVHLSRMLWILVTKK